MNNWKKVLTSLSLTLSLNLVIVVQSQNLVPNGSFEDYYACPDRFGQLHLAKGWYALQHSSELYNECHSSPYNVVDVPWNAWGYQEARTGKGYAGCAFIEEYYDYHENISVKLINSLLPGKTYILTFYVSLAEVSGRSISNPSALFSLDSILPMAFYGRILLKPQIELSGQFFSDTINWMKVSGSFIASGGERFLTLGLFSSYDSTDLHFIKPLTTYAYYYIDDVSLYLTETPVDTANAGSDLVICKGTTAVIGKPELPGHDYRWYIDGDNLIYNTAQIAVAPDTSTTYYLKVTDFKFDITWDSVTVMVIDCAQPDKEIVLYPNPSDGTFTIEFNHIIEGSSSFFFYDAVGKLSGEVSFENGGNRYEFSKPSLASGAYQWVMTQHGEVTETGTLVITR